MHNQNVNGARRSAREGMAVEFDDSWPIPHSGNRSGGGAVVARSRARALARIPEERRQVILLIGLEDISYEAATILDVPIGTIRSRLSRGRESLRTLMDRRDGTEAVRHVMRLRDRERRG
jgi:RNA polymerase sigma-70 factor (ECF subfamily)